MVESSVKSNSIMRYLSYLDFFSLTAHRLAIRQSSDSLLASLSYLSSESSLVVVLSRQIVLQFIGEI